MECLQADYQIFLTTKYLRVGINEAIAHDSGIIRGKRNIKWD